MKYEAKVDLRNANTSHALLVELVGRDKRVLDVGCASGYLGEALKARGCTVVGVETDEEAAEAAKGVLDEVVVGDIGAIDVVARFGAGRFDAVVFGDVLEHVVDPEGVLRAVRPLLAPGGFVVASIPNVAHGSVRLSLMSGRFEYRPLGLLDETHVRFFTRTSLHALLADAGFVPTDVRRTTAGVFETEVSARREDYDAKVVDAVEDDPDATTYQFVVKAFPEDSSEIDAVAPTPSPAPAARCRVGLWAACPPNALRDALLLRITRHELERRLPHAAFRTFTWRGYQEPTPHAGGEHVEPLSDLAADRLDLLADQLDCVVVTGDVDCGDATDAGATSPFLREELGSDHDVDCPVLWSAVRLRGSSAGAAAASASNRAWATVVDEVGAGAERGEGDAAPVPDPLVLAARLLAPDALRRRLEFLRVMGWYPQDGAAVAVEAAGSMAGHIAAIGAALDTLLAERPGSSVVIVPRDPADAAAGRVADDLSATLRFPAFRVPADAPVDDVVAAMAHATVIAASSSSAVSLALAFARPHAALDLGADHGVAALARSLGNLDGVVTRPGELSELLQERRFRPLPAPAGLMARLDVDFDRIAAIADGAAAARPRTTEIGPVLPAPEYVAALEVAHTRMRQRLDAEHSAVADHLVALEREHVRRLAALQDDLDASDASAAAERARAVVLQARVDTVEQELTRMDAQAEQLGRLEQEIRRLRAIEDRLAADLEALSNIRTLRLIRPVRAFYARLRGSRL